MSAFGFVYYYKNKGMKDICKLCKMNVFSLKPTNKKLSNKEKD